MTPLGINSVLGLTFVMGAVIFFCRAFPFLLFRNRKGPLAGGEPVSGRTMAFLSFVERVVPPVAMTVLTFNAVCLPIKEDPSAAFPVLAASAATALLHLWKGNSLISIFGGTLLYMILNRIIIQ
ncbi:MAG: AzlD domain-containing protein [Treponema sp.]|jgi:branched-subunit amino acid transport protein AzlD|nr:AzlD domain-containing protein [Treponema sp.]